MTESETAVSLLTGLNRLAYNLWWAWNPTAQDLFEAIDRRLWKEVDRNPVVFLKRLSREALIEAVSNEEVIAFYRRVMTEFDAYCNPKSTWFTEIYPKCGNILVAYFSAEFGLHEAIPVYSGGLGILAGDHCKAASDVGLPFVGVGLLSQCLLSKKISPLVRTPLIVQSVADKTSQMVGDTLIRKVYEIYASEFEKIVMTQQKLLPKVH